MSKTTISTHAPSELLDYAEATMGTDADHLLCIFLLEGQQAGPVLAITPGRGTLNPFAFAYQADRQIAQVNPSATSLLLVFTGRMAHTATARQVTSILSRSWPVRTALTLQAENWRDLHTEQTGTWEKGTSTIGLTLAMQDSPARTPMTAPASAASSSLRVPVPGAGSDRGVVERACARLASCWPVALSSGCVSDVEAEELLGLLGTAGLFERTTALTVLFPEARGAAATCEEIGQGMPQGVEWDTAAASEALLCELISRAPGHGAVGPLQALAYLAWLRGYAVSAVEMYERVAVISRRHCAHELAATAAGLATHRGARIAACALNPATAYHP